LLTRQRLDGLAVPVLLVEGRLSPPIRGAIQTELARRLPLVQRVTIDSAGHMPPITHPVPPAGALRDHLART
jgi:pimeloyl-ACP methyl ester carboxylesterase